jgi:hypothetical protein
MPATKGRAARVQQGTSFVAVSYSLSIEATIFFSKYGYATILPAFRLKVALVLFALTALPAMKVHTADVMRKR